jgi:hypothetical protein
MNRTQKYLLDLNSVLNLYYIECRYNEDDEKWKGTFVGYPIHSKEMKPYCIKFIEYPYGNYIWIHVYNYFYKITFPFLKDVRNFKKTTLVKLLCKQEDIPSDLEFIIIKYCF